MGRRVIWIVLDSVGAGCLPDAADFGDDGADTLGHIIKSYPDIRLDTMRKLGLFAIEGTSFQEKNAKEQPIGCYGRAVEASKGKDTTTGHWEMVGIHTKNPFPTYPNGFPQDVIESFIKKTGCGAVYGNKVASGIPIIEEYIEEHMKTGYPIVYTSADSVFQIAASEEKVGLERLYEMCEIARGMLQGEHGVGRVIARPFVKTEDGFKRTSNRRDYALNPSADNVLVHLKDAGENVIAVGKIRDIFNGVGITRDIHTDNNTDGMAKTKQLVDEVSEGLIFTNLVDFDMVYGHRRDLQGYKEALEAFDAWLGELLPMLKEDDLLVINADHGCDPTYKGSDHTREYIPVLLYGKKLTGNISLETRECFADIGQTIKQYLLENKMDYTLLKPSNAIGKSFLDMIRG
ncbi:MAG: phosphopentomutase [Lachnospiraceae bacterium]|nr:phosphopentomutase [Lachnospiraceae bacterium]